MTKTSNYNTIDNKKNLVIMIPYCCNCSRKTKKEAMTKDEYYCDVLIDTPMKGVVTSDIDGTHCVELEIYKPIKNHEAK